MIQSSLRRKVNPSPGLHVAMIMDGNGRWATRQGLPRVAGHRAGVATVRRIAEAAPDLGVSTLTLFAFSADNWRRPPSEVCALMGLMSRYLRAETRRMAEQGIRFTTIGRRDRIPPALRAEIEQAEDATARGTRLFLRIALDYSSRAAISRAALALRTEPAPCAERMEQLLSEATDSSCARVDILIRTGGEKRLSDFLLWESAYAELFFTNTMWPEFGAADLKAAIDDFHRRERRFGGLGAAGDRASVQGTLA